MKLRRRIVLVLGSSKYPLKEEEPTFIKSSTHNNLGEVISINSKGFTLAFGARKVRESDIENSLTVCIAIREHVPTAKFGVSYGLVSIDEKKDGSIKIEGQITKAVKHLSSIASYSHISVDESITKIYSRIFDIRHIKAKDKDVYNVYGFKKTPSRIRGLREAYGKLIGRDKEFGELQNLLLQIASDQGQMVGVVGEAGIGKTRITHELKTLLKMRGIKYFEGSFPYFGGSTYKGFKDIISQIANINTQDLIQNIEKKLKRIGDKYDLEKPDIDFLINLFVILPTSDVIKNLNEEQIKLGTFVAVKKLIFKIAENPLVIILEDMQNADELSASLADFMAEGLPEMKLLFYMNYRPEFHGKFEEKIYFNWIRLQRFDEQKAKEFLSSLLDIDKIPKKLLKLIQKKSAGNPLYIEELVRSLLDKGKIKVENNQLQFTEDINPSDIQPTIHGVISYRIEKLPQETSQVLKWGSCIGDEIDVKLLKTILKRNISKDIEELELKDFIYEVSIYPEEIYKFRHDLIREVSYESLPLNQKRLIHLKIGNYLEKKYKFEIEERLEDLANHFIKSTDYEKAFHYSYKAAQKLKSNYSNEEAIELFNKTYDLVDKTKIKHKREIKKEILEYERDVFLQIAKFDGALRVMGKYKKIINPRNQGELAKYSRLLGEVQCRRGNYDVAIKLLMTSLNIFKKLDNSPEIVKTLIVLMSVHALMGNKTEVRKYADMTLTLITHDEKKEKGIVYQRLASVYMNEGLYQKALKYFDKSACIFEEIDELYYLSIVIEYMGTIYSRLGDFKNSVIHTQKALNISKSIGNLNDVALCHQNLAVVYDKKGEIKNAISEYKRSLKLLEQVGSFNSLGIVNSNLAYMYHIFGDFDGANKYLSDSKKCFETASSKFWIAQNHLVQGKIAKDKKKSKESETNLNKSKQLFEELGEKSKIVDVLMERIDLYKEMNDEYNFKALVIELSKLQESDLGGIGRQRFYLAKLKANLALGKEIFKINENPDHLEDFIFEYKLEAFIELANYARKVKKDIELEKIYLGRAKSLFEKLEAETPEELKGKLGNRIIYREFIKMIN